MTNPIPDQVAAAVREIVGTPDLPGLLPQIIEVLRCHHVVDDGPNDDAKADELLGLIYAHPLEAVGALTAALEALLKSGDGLGMGLEIIGYQVRAQFGADVETVRRLEEAGLLNGMAVVGACQREEDEGEFLVEPDRDDQTHDDPCEEVDRPDLAARDPYSFT